MREEQARFAAMELVKRVPTLTPMLFQLRETQTPWQECLKTLQEAAAPEVTAGEKI